MPSPAANNLHSRIALRQHICLDSPKGLDWPSPAVNSLYSKISCRQPTCLGLAKLPIACTPGLPVVTCLALPSPAADSLHSRSAFSSACLPRLARTCLTQLPIACIPGFPVVSLCSTCLDLPSPATNNRFQDCLSSTYLPTSA